MNWKIEWRDKDGVASHSTGATFLVTRSGWVAVQEAGGQTDDELVVLIAELHDVLANVSRNGEAIH